jgi:hypothetical protein
MFDRQPLRGGTFRIFDGAEHHRDEIPRTQTVTYALGVWQVEG